MIMDYKEIPYNTNRECYQIEDIIIKTALNDGKYSDIIQYCKDHDIQLQYDDTYRTKRNLVKRTTGSNWTKIKKEIQEKANDYSGITPTREGYLYDGKIYDSVKEAHYLKLKRKYPKLARIIYE